MLPNIQELIELPILAQNHIMEIIAGNHQADRVHHNQKRKIMVNHFLTKHKQIIQSLTQKTLNVLNKGTWKETRDFFKFQLKTSNFFSLQRISLIYIPTER